MLPKFLKSFIKIIYSKVGRKTIKSVYNRFKQFIHKIVKLYISLIKMRHSFKIIYRCHRMNGHILRPR